MKPFMLYFNLYIIYSYLSKNFQVSFKMKHDFINMVVALAGDQPKEPQVVWLTHVIKLRLGTVVGET